MVKPLKVNRKGIIRELFLQRVGDISRWRGRVAVFKDRRQDAKRKACRTRVIQDE